jgi:tetratricopeptide (TPR) repeat protein
MKHDRGWSLIGLMLLLMTLVAGCASDTAMVAWETELGRVELMELKGGSMDALAGYQALEERSPTATDADLVRLAQARVLGRLERLPRAVALYEDIARSAIRRSDRARARYEIVDLADRAGYIKMSHGSYRRLVETYPDLMPGSNALLRLEAEARRGSAAELADHLEWSSRVYERVAHTGVGDNLLYFAARHAVRLFRQGDRGSKDIAITLYRRLVAKHPAGNLADDAMWDISYLEENTGHWEQAIATIRAIQRHQKITSVAKNSEHSFHWLGDLRVGWIYSQRLNQPKKAAKVYEAFTSTYPESRWHDDALYWLGCLKLQFKDRRGAERHFRRIEVLHPDSRYLKRFDQAKAEPTEGSCVPRHFEASW